MKNVESKTMKRGDGQTLRTAYKALGIVVILNLMMGVQYCWSVISPRCIAQFGWSPTQAALPYTVLTVTNAMAAIPVSRWGEKKEPGRVVFMGGIFVGLGIFLCSLMHSLPGMILGYGIVTSFGLASISMNTSPTAMKWFPAERKGFAIGVATMCIGLSSLLFSPIINGLLDQFGMTTGLRLLSVGSAIIICFFSLLLKAPPKGPGTEKNADESVEKTAALPADDSRYHDTINANQALLTREFWLILAIYAINWMPGQMIFSSVSTICEVQASWDKGYIAVMAMSIGNGVGRLISASLTDRFGGLRTMRILMVIQIANLLVFRFYTNPYWILPGIVLMGACVGAGIPLVYVIVSNIYGMKYVGSINAMVQFGYAISGVIGPLMAARMLEMTGTYQTAYYTNAAFLMLGIVCVAVTRRNKA